MKTAAVIMEIRAGAGGEEAALFARDLFQAYARYAKKMNWKLEIFDENKTNLRGCRRICFRLFGEDSWNKMRNEAGTHRVQRIPTTEKTGRIQTSTVTVAVYPQEEFQQTKINPNDIKMDFFRSSGPGGQNVNKRETAVRLTHQPTGLVVNCQTSRSQQKNKELAFQILQAKLAQKQKEEQIESQKNKKKIQIGSAERAEKIRTYHFPRNQITDHRTKKNWHNLEDVMRGEMDKMIRSLAKIQTD